MTLIRRIINKIRRIIKKILSFVYWKILYNTFTILPIKNQVFFESFLGKNFSSVPKYIYEYLNENYGDDFKFIVSVREPSNLETDGNLKVVKKMSLKYLYYLATSKYIVNNSRMPINYHKRKNQIYFQTWHGTPLKKLVYDMENVNLPNTNKENYYENFSKDVQMWDYLLASNEYSKQIFKRAFRYYGEIITTTYPQIQSLLQMNHEDEVRIKNKLNIPFDNKVILYCPTFRDNEYIKKGHYIQNVNIDLEKIKKELNEENITLILRTHYLVKEIVYKYSDENIINLSDYDEINDLYHISNMLITDYSSVFFEYMYLKRPIIFYQYDQETYKQDLRDFYIPLEDLPGDIVTKEYELYDVINGEIGKTNRKVEEFLLKYNIYATKENSLKHITDKIFTQKQE